MKPVVIDSEKLMPFHSIGIAHAVRAGNTLYISGMISLDLQGNIVGKGDPEAQTVQVYESIRIILEELEATMKNVVKITTFFVNPGDFKTISEVRKRYFDKEHRPASSSVVIKALAHPDALVEIEAVAVLGD